MNTNKVLIREKQFARRMQEEKAVIGQMVANAIREYHTRFVEPRYRRIEWMLLPLRLWDLAWTGWYRLRGWVKSKLARKAE